MWAGAALEEAQGSSRRSARSYQFSVLLPLLDRRQVWRDWCSSCPECGWRFCERGKESKGMREVVRIF